MRSLEYIMTDLTTSPKIASILMLIGNGSNFISNNFDVILTRMTGVASLILIIIMIRYHIKNTRKIDKENSKDDE
jgi:preprotein translocase subunit SecG